MTLRNLILIAGIALIYSACRVIPKPYSLNESVKQPFEKSGIDSVIVIPGEIYAAGKFKRFLLGDHYRDTWTTPVKVPILDFDEAKEGLTILDKGGGQQTYSLKLEADNGKLYSLRSIQKDPSPTLPETLKNSFADDVVQDQISASHPFGAFILPPLGDAAGIYHTNPRMVYIPDTERLGKYRTAFGGVLAMLEQDADENWSDYEDFGFTENAISTRSVIEDLSDNNDNRVDEENLLRARLFDIWIGDWDRHDGQFRWAEFEDDRGKYFRPIPEDRDNAFFKFDGFIPWWARRKWSLRKFQSFDEDIRDLAGLNHNARYLDRRFLTESPRAKWIEIAKDLQSRLTDEVIESAVSILPDKVYANDGNFLITNLKARRDKFTEFAERYYAILAKEVDIVGSNANEYVEVTYEDSSVNVKISDATDDGEKKAEIYNRTFYYNETDEVRIYTLGDEDFIYLKGNASKAPKVRVIAGEGEDFIYDSSQVKGLSKNNYIYDNVSSTSLLESKETKNRLSESLDVNKYEFKSFKYDFFGPAVFLGSNNDDGIYLGGGLVFKKNGFRKDPYASYHKIVANVAPNTLAWNFETEHDFKEVSRNMGINIIASVRAPNFFTNFYGLGNETNIDPNLIEDNNDFYKVNFNEASIFPGITVQFSDNSIIKFGPEYQYISFEPSNNILTNSSVNVGEDVFDDNHFIGARIDADIKTIKSTIYPKNGFRWKTSINWQSQLGAVKRQVSNLKSELSAYYSFEKPTLITLAARIGAASLSGNFAFYQANTIGGNAGLGKPGNLRGFNRDRFSGRTSVYQNNEIRIRLARIPFYYLPLSIGVLGHYDQGRVWVDEERSSKWHNSFGGGIWFNPIGKWVFTVTYSNSEENDSVLLNLGFLF
ncbi:MAG: hypothetical protein WD431_14640 [Cyclobacteriaceae bacterium]